MVSLTTEFSSLRSLNNVLELTESLHRDDTAKGIVNLNHLGGWHRRDHAVESRVNRFMIGR